MDELDRIRNRVERATAGPWYSVGPPWNSGTPFVVAGSPDPHVGGFVCDLANFGEEDNDNAVADAEFIAHARADVEALLAEIDRLTTELQAAQAGGFEWVGDHYIALSTGRCIRHGEMYTPIELGRLREREGVDHGQ